MCRQAVFLALLFSLFLFVEASGFDLSLYSIIHISFLALFEQKNYNVVCGGLNMDYMTLKEASEKWGVTPRRINYYCTADRIPGAVKMGTVWLIPKNSQKPADRRFKSIRSKDGENK